MTVSPQWALVGTHQGSQRAQRRSEGEVESSEVKLVSGCGWITGHTSVHSADTGPVARPHPLPQHPTCVYHYPQPGSSYAICILWLRLVAVSANAGVFWELAFLVST